MNKTQRFVACLAVSIRSLNRHSSTDSRERASTWRQPVGHDTGIRVFNSQTRTKVPLILPRKNLLNWYTCGPTVYDDAHIGHASCYMKFDIVRRILERFFNINVVQLMGITDIDDKIIARANQSNTQFQLLAKKYELDFWRDLRNLGIRPPNIALRVSQVVPQIIQFTDNIVQKGFGYVAADGTVYFDVSKYGPHYPKLIGKLPESDSQLEKDEQLKRGEADFALWKAAKANEPSWHSPWGQGRPGWHIECSTMASLVFGNTVDVHSGGVDLRFPHHENELAQSCVHHQTDQWVNYWMHSGHLQLKNVKMSKSLNNFISIQQFLSQNSANEFRLFCLRSHYRHSVEYSEQVLSESKALLGRLRSFLALCSSYASGDLLTANFSEADLFEKLANCKDTVAAALADDFDTNRATTGVMDLISYCNKQFDYSPTSDSVRCPAAVVHVQSYVDGLLRDLGVILNSDEENNSNDRHKYFEAVVDSAVAFRQTMRSLALDKKTSDINGASKSTMLSACDRLRDEFGNVGIHVKDFKEGSTWSYEGS